VPKETLAYSQLKDSDFGKRSRSDIMQLLTDKFYIVVNMKYLSLSVASFILLAVVGCASSFSESTTNNGFDFPSENVKKIIKGKTTGNELIQMFGGPLFKWDVSEDEEHWMYSYTTGNKFEVKGFLTDKVQSTSQHKSLFIFLKNGIITNFNYTETPEPLGSAQAH
jgi:hypothetical protein